MPDKKLTDKEIVNKLERYKDVKDTDVTTTSFNTILLKKIYFLINRLQAENENYSKNNQQMTSDILKLYKELEQAKAENKELKKTVKVLRIGVEQAYLIRKDGKSPFNLLKAEIKAEAYKEFAEKTNSIIESLIEQYSIKDFEEFKAICQVLRGLKNDTNNLLKELGG